MITADQSGNMRIVPMPVDPLEAGQVALDQAQAAEDMRANAFHDVTSLAGLISALIAILR